MNKEVNFEIAKLLKEKGFHQHHEFSKGYTKNGDLFHQGYGDLNKTQDYFQAPTIAEVVMWLYEKHGIWVSVDMVFGEDQTGFWYCIRESKEDDIAIQSDEYGTITEAYEAAITYCLENLIQGGNK